MPIHDEVTKHQFHCEGESMTEAEHAERCDINYQMKRVSKGLTPNWGGSNTIQYGFEKMDNSLTDHRIAINEEYEKLRDSDLSEISDEHFSQLNPTIQAMFSDQRNSQLAAKKAKNDEKLKNDEKTKTAAAENLDLLASTIAEKLDPAPTPQPRKKTQHRES